MTQQKDKPLLVYRFSALGDIAMTIPVLRSFFKTYPDQKIIFVSRNYAKPELIKGNNNFYYRTGTNGITYHSIVFPCNALSEEEFKIASLFSNTLTDIGIGDKNYEEVQKLQSAVTGGMSANFVLLPDQSRENPTLGLKISSKSLERNENKMQDLMIETIKDANFNDAGRIKDMLNFISSDNERSLIQNGHMLAMSNAGAQINNIAATKAANNANNSQRPEILLRFRVTISSTLRRVASHLISNFLFSVAKVSPRLIT